MDVDGDSAVYCSDCEDEAYAKERSPGRPFTVEPVVAIDATPAASLFEDVTL